MRLRRVSVRVAPADAEIARWRLLELAPAGLEERELDGAVELAVYTGAEGEACVRAVFDAVESRPVAAGWEDGWKAFHRPVEAGGLWIGPPWLERPAGAAAVVVDPGRAFGTGAHPTTRACVELLARCERGSVLDAGCGSGVLTVAAARLGFAPVHAVDLDPTAVDAARATCAANGVEAEVRQADVLRDQLPSVDLVIANIELAVVERLLERRPAARAVTSGYLARDEPHGQGWARAERLEVDDWAADILVCAPTPVS